MRPGDVLDRYRLTEPIGSGSMGSVWRAEHTVLRSEVALKILEATRHRDRFLREGQTAFRVRHPNLVGVTDHFEAAGRVVLVMELIEGPSLDQWLDDHRPTADEAIQIARDVLLGLQALHARGIVHRDLKPANVLLERQGDRLVARVTDFGIVKLLDQDQGATRTGAVMGTPAYMAPEQMTDAKRTTAASDVFSFGALFFNLLTGRRAYEGDGWEAMDAIRAGVVPDMPASMPLADAVRACLARDPIRRPTVGALLALLPATGGFTAEALATATLGKEAMNTMVPDLVSSAPGPHHLPAERDTFVGRDADLERLAASLPSDRLVTLLGMGGTGKTRLVTRFAWAHRDDFPGGAWFGDLSDARSLDDICRAVATALDVRLERAPVAELADAILRHGPCLVILDNFEQVVDHAAATVGVWLDRAPEARFIVTSRAVLGLPGEAVLALDPLPVAEATELFVSRAGSQLSPDERVAVASLVVLLDGLPLAIELAAARTRAMSPTQLLARMRDRFKVVASSSGRPTRHATLRGVLDWSWDLLGHDERAALAQLSVFDGGLTLEAAEAVLALPSMWPADAVQALVDHSWVRRARDGRLDLLVSVREYAAEKLEVLGQLGEIEARHGTHFAAYGTDESLLAQARPDGASLRQAVAVDLDNVMVACRRAVARNDADVAVGTLCAAGPVLEQRGPSSALDALSAGVTGLALPDRLKARAFVARGRALWLSGRSDARSFYEQAVALYAAVGDREHEARALGDLGGVCHEQGRTGEAQAHLERALALHREIGNRSGEGLALVNLANVHWQLGRIEVARAHYEKALELFRAFADRRLESGALWNLGDLEHGQGRLDEARTHYERALSIAREEGHRRFEGVALARLGSVLLDLGDSVRAEALQAEALAIHREVGDRAHEMVALAQLGRLHRQAGRLDQAEHAYDQAFDLHREIGNPQTEGILRAEMARLHLDQGRTEQARDGLEVAERLLREVDDPVELGKVLATRARLEAGSGQRDLARAALTEAESLAEKLGVERASEIARLIEEARAAVA